MVTVSPIHASEIFIYEKKCDYEFPIENLENIDYRFIFAFAMFYLNFKDDIFF